MEQISFTLLRNTVESFMTKLIRFLLYGHFSLSILLSKDLTIPNPFGTKGSLACGQRCTVMSFSLRPAFLCEIKLYTVARLPLNFPCKDFCLDCLQHDIRRAWQAKVNAVGFTLFIVFV